MKTTTTFHVQLHPDSAWELNFPSDEPAPWAVLDAPWPEEAAESFVRTLDDDHEFGLPAQGKTVRVIVTTSDREPVTVAVQCYSEPLFHARREPAANNPPVLFLRLREPGPEADGDTRLA